MKVLSPARMRLALGPGSSVRICGPAEIVVLAMESSCETCGARVLDPRLGFAHRSETRATQSERRNGLVGTEEVGARVRGQHRERDARTREDQAQPRERA